MIAYLFLPKIGKPPFQTVIYWPGGAAYRLRSVEDYGRKDRFDWLTKNGRAVIWPVYKGTFERQYSVEKWTSIAEREFAVMCMKDLQRTLDYLETREEFDHEKISAYGLSSGVDPVSIAPAVENRIKAIILMGGSFDKTIIPEWSQYNFAPRVKTPVLLLSGKYDFANQLDREVKALLKLFGTSDKDKHHKIYDTGHAIWMQNEWKRDALEFLDKYFGLPNQGD
jgi:dienelactone hydrolase